MTAGYIYTQIYEHECKYEYNINSPVGTGSKVLLYEIVGQGSKPEKCKDEVEESSAGNYDSRLQPANIKCKN